MGDEQFVGSLIELGSGVSWNQRMPIPLLQRRFESLRAFPMRAVAASMATLRRFGAVGRGPRREASNRTQGA